MSLSRRNLFTFLFRKQTAYPESTPTQAGAPRGIISRRTVLRTGAALAAAATLPDIPLSASGGGIGMTGGTSMELEAHLTSLVTRLHQHCDSMIHLNREFIAKTFLASNPAPSLESFRQGIQGLIYDVTDDPHLVRQVLEAQGTDNAAYRRLFESFAEGPDGAEAKKLWAEIQGHPLVNPSSVNDPAFTERAKRIIADASKQYYSQHPDIVRKIYDQYISPKTKQAEKPSSPATNLGEAYRSDDTIQVHDAMNKHGKNWRTSTGCPPSRG